MNVIQKLMDRDFIKSAEEHSSLSLIALYVCLLG